MPEAPTVSIIVPCYRAAATLDATLASIESQTSPDWECLIIDDGSPDDCAAIANSWCGRDARFKLIRQENSGLARARNRGIADACGQYLLFLDPDDLIASGKLACHLAVPPADHTLAYGGCRFFTDDPTHLTLGRDGSDRPWMPGLEGTAASILSALTRENIVPVSAPLVPAALVRKVGGYDADLPAMEDWDFWIRCTLAGATWRFDRDPLAETWIRVLPGSMSSQGPRMFAAEWTLRQKHLDLPEMQQAFVERRRFHLKAMLADLLKLNWGTARLRARYLPSLAWRLRRRPLFP